MDYQVRAVVERAQKRRRREGGVDDEGEAVAVRDLRVALDVRYVERWVAHGLDIDEAGLLVYGGLDGGEVVDLSEVHLYADVG